MERRSVPAAGPFVAFPGYAPLPADAPPALVGPPAAGRPPAVDEMTVLPMSVRAGVPAKAVVAYVRATDATLLRAAIDWGDGTRGDGTFAPDDEGGYQVVGVCDYQQPGRYTFTVRMTAPDRDAVEATGSAEVLPAGGKDGPVSNAGGGGDPSLPQPFPAPPPTAPGGPDVPDSSGPFTPEPPSGGPTPTPASGPPPAPPPPVVGQILWVQTPDPRPAEGDTRGNRPAPPPAAGTPGPPDGALAGATPPAPPATAVPGEHAAHSDGDAAADPPMIPGYLIALRPGDARAVTGRTGPAAAVTPAGGRIPATAPGAEDEADVPAPAVGDVAALLEVGRSSKAPPHCHAGAVALADGALIAPAAAGSPTRPAGRRESSWWQCLPLCVLMVLWNRAAGEPRPPQAPPTLA